MKTLKKLYCRTFQTAFKIALPFLPYRDPKTLTSIDVLLDILKENQTKKPLIITDKNLSRAGLTDYLQSLLKTHNVSYALFDEVFPNPTTSLAITAYDFYKKNKCDSIIAFGGGSPMDLAKAVGVLFAKKGKPLEKMAGILKVHKKLPLLIAIPTTAGTGSETTLASVLINSETHHKFAINDFPLIPRYAILDPATIRSLPESIAAPTGIDALTHAVEAYIGRSTTSKTRADAEKAVSLIFEHLDAAVHHQSAEDESAMLMASHLAGRAFTRSYVGYIHAVSHSISGKYNLPHGWTNAVLLPVVLRLYGTAAEKKLAHLAVCASLGNAGEDQHELAERFIKAIEDMNKKYNIPSKIDCIKEEDIPLLASYADKEANPLYPVPVLWDNKELESIYFKVK